jgi:hypothetical protein
VTPVGLKISKFQNFKISEFRHHRGASKVGGGDEILKFCNYVTYLAAMSRRTCMSVNVTRATPS